MHGSVEVAAELQCEELASARTRVLLAAATFLSGILAGGAVDRAIVGGPAWHALGASVWAQYSRLADLGSGLVAYPIEGIGSALLIIATAISSHFDRAAARAVWLPLYFERVRRILFLGTLCSGFCRCPGVRGLGLDVH